MEKLLKVLQDLVNKYNIAQEDVAAIQEALSELETGGVAEFEYTEEPMGEEVEEK